MMLDLENLLVFAPTLLVVVGGMYQFRRRQKRDAEINRAVDEQIRREAETEERLRVMRRIISVKSRF